MEISRIVAKSVGGTNHPPEVLMGSRPLAIDALKVCALLVLVAGSLSFAGCAPQRVAFTQGIRTHYDLGSGELKNLQ